MLFITVIAVVTALIFGYVAIARGTRIDQLIEDVDYFSAKAVNARLALAKSDEIVVNLTEAERERVNNRILKKKDNGKKVR